jgi:hypothetical protein
MDLRVEKVLQQEMAICANISMKKSLSVCRNADIDAIERKRWINTSDFC